MDVIDANRLWDVIIVGSGMGGGSVALPLARAGFSVLVLERGSRVDPEAPSSQGAEDRMQGGWWPEPLTIDTPTGSARILPPMGCAVGGSTIHYAAALVRMDPSDFEPLRLADGSTVAWPLAYAEMEPYYAQAEQLFGVSVEGAWQRMSDWDRALAADLRSSGLHPEPLPVAIRYDEHCIECINRVCPRRCKANAAETCLDEAGRHPGFHLLEQCEVTHIEADADRVQAVLATVRGQPQRLQGRIVVLAAGAIHSARLLLRSASPQWPLGLANASGLVGRNLMFHTVDILALWPRRRYSRTGRQKKSLSLRDFHTVNGQRLGYGQSLGLDAGRGEIALYLKNQLELLGIRQPLLQKLLANAGAVVAARLLGRAGLFVLSAEDDPHPENRLLLDTNEPDGIRIRYSLPEELQQRSQSLRSAFRRAVRPWRAVPLFGVPVPNYGHACGTCRFGTDPADSVLDPDCRAHGIGNLFVVDGSFLPRSGATNPSLTIAANALRVAEAIRRQLAQAGPPVR